MAAAFAQVRVADGSAPGRLRRTPACGPEGAGRRTDCAWVVRSVSLGNIVGDLQMKRYNVGIIGVGGYGRSHVDALEECEKRGWARLAAAAVRPEDRAAQRETLDRLAQRGVRIHSSADELFAAERGVVDLIVVPVGIDQHAPLSIAALEAGYHVLCEKPAAGSTAEALRMQAAQQRTGRTLAIGFQNLFSPSVNRIKEITLAGRLGRLLTARTMVLWPRGPEYYARNEWAGRLSVRGTWIYDSPVQNAVAHFLQNMLYVAGRRELDCIEPTAVYAENYRAKPIESTDTQFVRVEGENGEKVEILVTHACRQKVEPVTEYLFERGRILWELEPSGTAQLFRADEKGWLLEDVFDNGEDSLAVIKYRELLAALDAGRRPHSTIDNALAHTRCATAALQDSEGKPSPARIAPVADVHLDDPGSGTIKDIVPLMAEMFRTGKSFFEVGAPWGVKGLTVHPIAAGAAPE